MGMLNLVDGLIFGAGAGIGFIVIATVSIIIINKLTIK
jgi:hypothetical protein